MSENSAQKISRGELFAPDSDIDLTKSDLQALWPTIDNVWVTGKSVPRKTTGDIVRNYSCRFGKHYMKADSKVGKMEHLKDILKGKPCGARLRVIESSDGQRCIINLASEHTHSLQAVDDWKKCTAHGGKVRSRSEKNKTPEAEKKELQASAATTRLKTRLDEILGVHVLKQSQQTEGPVSGHENPMSPLPSPMYSFSTGTSISANSSGKSNERRGQATICHVYLANYTWFALRVNDRLPETHI